MTLYIPIRDPQEPDSSEDLRSTRFKRRARLVDIIQASAGPERTRWQIGLTIASLSLMGVIVARLVYFLSGVSGSPMDLEYLSAGSALSIAWFIAIVLVTPGSI